MLTGVAVAAIVVGQLSSGIAGVAILAIGIVSVGIFYSKRSYKIDVGLNEEKDLPCELKEAIHSKIREHKAVVDS